MKTKKFALSVVAVMSIVLTGCVPVTPNTSPSSPIPSPTSSSITTPSSVSSPPITPSATPDPVTALTKDNAKIVIGSDNLFIKSLEGNTLHKYSFDASPQEAISVLDDIYDRSAVTTYSGEETCWYQMTTYDWGNFTLSFQSQDIDTSEWFIASSEADLTQPNPLVETLHGAVIGESYSEYLPRVAGNPRIDYGNYHFVLDEQTDDYAYSEQEMNAYGAIVNAVDDTITNIVAPSFLNSDC